MRKSSTLLAGLLILGSTLASCSSAEGVPDVPQGGETVVLVGRTLTAVVEGVADEQLGDDLWAIDVKAIHYSRPALYLDSGGEIELLPVQASTKVPMFVDVQLEQGVEYLFIASHVEIGGPEVKLSAHGIVTAGQHEPVQAFLPGLADLLIGEEPDTASSRVAALTQLLEEAEARDRARAPSGEEGPRHDRAMEILTALGIFETSSRPDGFDASLGMSVEAYLDMEPTGRQLVEFYEMPQEVLDRLELVSVPLIVVTTEEMVASHWAVGVRTEIGTAGPYTVTPNTLGLSLDLAAPGTGTLEIVVWPSQPDDLGAPLIPLAVGLDDSDLQAALGKIALPGGSGEILLIDIPAVSVKWISGEAAIALTTSWGRTGE